jgi:hypothetical protein
MSDEHRYSLLKREKSIDEKMVAAAMNVRKVVGL